MITCGHVKAKRPLDVNIGVWNTEANRGVLVRLGTAYRESGDKMDAEVSVIVVTDGVDETLRRSLESVFQQTHRETEIIVAAREQNQFVPAEVDSGTCPVVCHRVQEIDDPFVSALNVAQGRYVALLWAGDEFIPEKVALQVKAFRERSQMGLILTAYQLSLADQTVRPVGMPNVPRQDLLYMLLHCHRVNLSSVMLCHDYYKQEIPSLGEKPTIYQVLMALAQHHTIGVLNQALIRAYEPSDDAVRNRRRAIQHAVSAMAAAVSDEELFPNLTSSGTPLAQSAARAVKGAILLDHALYESAQQSFSQAQQLCPSAAIHHFWRGMLAQRTGDIQAASGHYANVPQEDGLYIEAQLALVLLSERYRASEQARLEDARQFDLLLWATLDYANGQEPYTAHLHPNIANDLRHYLGLTAAQVMEALLTSTQELADEWEAKAPETEEEVSTFYQQTHHYLFDLAWWHQGRGRQSLTRQILHICERANVSSVLDFGCGVGQDGIVLAKQGFAVTLADLPGKTFDFAKWRASHHGLPIEFVPADALTKQYDAILCMDVLEHLWEPLKTLEYLNAHLRDGGLLLVTATFDSDDTHPMHLQKNIPLTGHLPQLIESLGFTLESTRHYPFVFRKTESQP